MIDVPGFVTNVKYLGTKIHGDGMFSSSLSLAASQPYCFSLSFSVLASIFCGLFSAIRGSIFTVVGGRVNVRLRVQLMDSLLSQGESPTAPCSPNVHLRIETLVLLNYYPFRRGVL